MIFLMTLLIPLLLLLSVGKIVVYIFSSLGLYSMANNTGIKNPWQAWVPFCRDYLLGSMSDRYNENTLGKHTKWRVILTVAQLALCPIAYISILSTMIQLAALDMGGYGFSYTFGIGSLLFSMLLPLALAIATEVILLICAYKLFLDFEPSRAVLYTILAFFGLNGIGQFLARNNVPVGIAGMVSPRQPQYKVPPFQGQYTAPPPQQ